VNSILGKKRILIIGNPGSGKTSLAARLSELLNLPFISLDRHYWKSGWVPTPLEEWRKQVAELVAGDKWIIDGNYDSSSDIRFPRAEAIIFLDFPTYICLWRAMRRMICSYGKVRPDMAEGCPERFDWPFIKWILNFRKNVTPKNFHSIEEYFRGECIIILKNPRQVSEFVHKLEKRK
jgi:adenylate kinase family enzyme